MFGYVLSDKPNMLIKDYILYRGYYCGICKCLGKNHGQLMRFTTNYDIAFLDILLHNIYGINPECSMESCVLNPFKKKLIVKNDNITLKSVYANDILIYYKAEDLIKDGDKRKGKIARRITKKAFKKAKAELPEVEEIVRNQYEKLRVMEKEGETSIDKVSDCFAVLLRDSIKALAGEFSSYDIEEMCYFLGKWIYLIDALDDLEKDYKEKNYNVFLLKYGNFEDKKTFIDNNRSEIEELISGAYNMIKNSFERLKFNIGDGILTNIIWYGLNTKSLQILGRLPVCKETRLKF